MDKTANKPRAGLVAALDVGTSKVCCFIAHVDGDGESRILGVGHQPASGMRAGAIVDMEAVETGILSVVRGAEMMAGEHIREVFVNVTDGAPGSRMVDAEIPVAGNEISHADVRRVLDECRLRANGADRALIHSIPIGYAVDGNRGIRDPRGMYGERLGVDIHMVTTSPGAVRNLSTCLSGGQLQARATVSTPYASALSTLVEDEMTLGVTLIDMGGGTTTIAGFADGELIHTGMVPVGGGHVTSDIAVGLDTPVERAERLKVLHASAVPAPADAHQVIDVPTIGAAPDAAARQLPRSLLVGIVQPRIEEIFEMVRDHIEDSGLPRAAGRRVVITGGASQIPGVKAVAEPILDGKVRLARPQGIPGLAEATSGPAFATCAGLLRYAALKHASDPCWGRGRKQQPGSVLGRMGVWLRENF